MIVWNARGYRNKKEEIRQRFKELNVYIAVITEMKSNSINRKIVIQSNNCIAGYNVNKRRR